MTPFPNAEDYVRAVQEPRRVFLPPALKRAEFAVHPVWQIPMPASGNAAVVFKARVDGKDQAMRFFIREDASSRQRYTALGRYFVDHGLRDCVAGATWLDDAIRVNDATWPMVQMHWVDGRTLDAYVAYLIERGDLAALAGLAAAWRQLIDRLQKAEFAHGDLQHGNVLIDSSSALRLVDFDGSWIVQFRGESPPKETGHPNYQRTGREWGRWMDTFPGLVIYTALLGLSKNSGPWSTLSTGENILFSQEDFAKPFRSKTWKYLSDIGDPEIDHLTNRLKECCEPDWVAEESLEHLLNSRPSIQLATAPTQIENPPPAGRHRDTPWWELTGSAPLGSRNGRPQSGPAAVRWPAPPSIGPPVHPLRPAWMSPPAGPMSPAAGPMLPSPSVSPPAGPMPLAPGSMPPPPPSDLEPLSGPAAGRPLHSSPSQSWYLHTSPPPQTPTNSAQPVRRPVPIALAIALAAGLIAWVIVTAGSGGYGDAAPIAAVVTGVIAFSLVLLQLRQKPQ